MLDEGDLNGGLSLKAKLARAAAEGVGNGQFIDAADGTEALGFVLDQIDATMLRRVLNFETEDRTLACEVSGRRLVRLLPSEADHASAPHAELFGTVLDAMDAEQVEGVCTVLSDLCRNGGAVSVSRGLPAGSGEAVLSGLTAPQLAASMGLDAGVEAEGGEGSVARFIDEAGSDILCAMRLTGEATIPLSGKTDDLALLSEWATQLVDRVLDPDGILVRGLGVDGLLCLGPSQTLGMHLLVGVRDGVHVIALGRTDAFDRLLRLWQAI